MFVGGKCVVQRKNVYFSIFTASAATLLLAFNNCSSQDSGSISGSSNLASAGCKVDPDVLVQQIKDGDYHVQIYAPESEAHNISEKLYLNNQGNPAKAPRWKTNVINWYYNPTNAPAMISSTALETIRSSMAYWTSVCNINFNYMFSSKK
jgi:type 1 fimbria pilin